MQTTDIKSTCRRCGRLVAILSLVAIGQIQPVCAASPIATWRNISQTYQTLGPDAALMESTTATAADPGSWALQWQRAKILMALGGPARVMAAADSLQDAGYVVATTAMAFSAAMATGDASAVQVLAEVPRPTGGGISSFIYDLAKANAALASGADAAVADSIAGKLTSDPLVAESGAAESFERTVLSLRLARLKVGVQRARRDNESALAGMSHQLAAARAGGLSTMSADLDYSIARFYMDQGRHDLALDHFASALETCSRLGLIRLRAQSLSWRGFALERLGRFAESTNDRMIAADLLRNQGDVVSSAFCQLGLGWVAWQAGKADLSLRAGREAAALFAAAKLTWGEAIAWENLGTVGSNLDRYELSEDAFGKAMELAIASNNTQRRLSILNNLGVLYWRQDRPDRAAEVYEELLVIHRASGDLTQEGSVLNNLALVSEQLNRFGQAEAMYRRCLDLAVAGAADTNATDEAALNNLARLLLKQNRTREAEKFARQARDASDVSSNALAKAEALATLGRLHHQAGHPQTALADLQAADQLLQISGQRKHRMAILYRIALIQREQGLVDDALATIQECEELATALHMPHFVALLRGERASTFMVSGNHLAALKEQRACFEAWESIRGLDLADGDRYREMSYTFGVSSLVALSTELDDPSLVSEAFAALQRKKARSLRDYAQADRNRIRPDLPDSLIARELAAGAEVSRIGDALATATADQADSLRSALSEAEISFLTIRRQLLADDVRYRRAAVAHVATLARIRDELIDDQTLVLDYLVGYGVEDPALRPVILFALDKSGLTVHKLENRGALEARVNLVVDMMGTPPSSAAQSAALQKASGDLATALLAPVAERLDRCQRLVVATDAYLHRVPVGALYLPDEKKYLIEKTAVIAVPNLAAALPDSMPGFRAGQHPDFDVAIWAGAVSGDTRGGTTQPNGTQPSLREAEIISSSFDRTHRLAAETTGRDALETLNRSGILTSSRVVHFIAHGYFDGWQPWRSGIYLGGSDTGPGSRLEIADVYHLPIDCDLVTLSACETARGELHPIDGLQGFAHALRQAGARSVLATRWRIEDTVAPFFMGRFYGHLADGLGRGEALRAVQLGFLDEPSLSHPFYWAPFVMIGEMDEGITLQRTSFWQRTGIWILGGGVLLLGCGLMILRRSI